ncbi:hypothetical protein EVAR_23124_1 [Eumeta japonica]|uniref:Uncharacterized protein n=1 Tax=Eumeta variegata TaxID=151549 RepID=A0A4C1VE15_EUMVA|nr:hypothetical protein EVAR_23124_1 [Eumeta japonica]
MQSRQGQCRCNAAASVTRERDLRRRRRRAGREGGARRREREVARASFRVDLCMRPRRSTLAMGGRGAVAHPSSLNLYFRRCQGRTDCVTCDHRHGPIVPSHYLRECARAGLARAAADIERALQNAPLTHIPVRGIRAGRKCYTTLVNIKDGPLTNEIPIFFVREPSSFEGYIRPNALVEDITQYHYYIIMQMPKALKVQLVKEQLKKYHQLDLNLIPSHNGVPIITTRPAEALIGKIEIADGRSLQSFSVHGRKIAYKLRWSNIKMVDGGVGVCSERNNDNSVTDISTHRHGRAGGVQVGGLEVDISGGPPPPARTDGRYYVLFLFSGMGTANRAACQGPVRCAVTSPPSHDSRRLDDMGRDRRDTTNAISYYDGTAPPLTLMSSSCSQAEIRQAVSGVTFMMPIATGYHRVGVPDSESHGGRSELTRAQLSRRFAK